MKMDAYGVTLSMAKESNKNYVLKLLSILSWPVFLHYYNTVRNKYMALQNINVKSL